MAGLLSFVFVFFSHCNIVFPNGARSAQRGPCRASLSTVSVPLWLQKTAATRGRPRPRAQPNASAAAHPRTVGAPGCPVARLPFVRRTACEPHVRCGAAGMPGGAAAVGCNGGHVPAHLPHRPPLFVRSVHPWLPPCQLRATAARVWRGTPRAESTGSLAVVSTLCCHRWAGATHDTGGWAAAAGATAGGGTRLWKGQRRRRATAAATAVVLVSHSQKFIQDLDHKWIKK